MTKPENYHTVCNTASGSRKTKSQISLKFGYRKETLHGKSTANNVHYGPDLVIQISTGHRIQILLKVLLWIWNIV
jgi:hypothetical protein